MGLLERARETAKESTGAASNFQSWAESSGFEHCGVFCQKGGLMLLKYAYGIDAESVFKSISTKDFWEGSLRTQGWITLDRHSPNFSAFTQFLGNSSKARVESFRMMRILPVEKDGGLCIFFAYDFRPMGQIQNDTSFAKGLSEILSGHKEGLVTEPTLEDLSGLLAGNDQARLCIVSLKRALDEARGLIEVSELTVQKILVNTIFEELFYIAKKLFAWPDFIFAEGTDEIKIAAIISNETEDEILKEQLLLEFKDILGLPSAQKVIVLTAGYSSDTEEILDYLLRG